MTTQKRIALSIEVSMDSMKLFTEISVFLAALTVFCPVASNVSDSSKYVSTGMQLTQVPSDIPSSAEQVILDENEIATVIDGAWVNLLVCNTLSLSGNLMTEITKETFYGLNVLEHLKLNRNRISEIHHDAFCPLPALRKLELANNQLTHLRPKVFRCVRSLNYLDLSGNLLKTFAMDFHVELTLDLSGNPLQCDVRMCWLKKDEKNGSLIWAEDGGGTPQTPNCANYPGQDWEDVTLQCHAQDCPPGFCCYPHACTPKVITEAPEGSTRPVLFVERKPTSSGDQVKVEDEDRERRSTEYSQCLVGPVGWIGWVLFGVNAGLQIIVVAVSCRKRHKMFGNEDQGMEPSSQNKLLEVIE